MATVTLVTPAAPSAALRPQGCKYYQWCCNCQPCKQRAEYEEAVRMATKIPSLDTAPKRCECEKPVNNDGTCLSCGKPIGSLRQAA
jgi:hypothetical protein